MINICIVEDELNQANLLKEYLGEVEKNLTDSFSITHITDGLNLVEDYKSQFDIILLDIQMKHMDGMTAAEKIREVDSNVVIIFVTSTVQYAVQGYSVDALGYVLKPVNFNAFEKLINKAVESVNSKKRKTFIQVNADDLKLKIDCETIIFIESQRNNVIIHTKDNSYTTLGPLKKFEEMLETYGFSKCHNAYLVNLSFVEGIQKEELVLLNGERLPISRAKKKEFLMALANDIL